jgi:hypothetical protein
MTEYTIHPDAPTDQNGHPIHPDSDKDHHICGRGKSPNTTETEHGRERDDYPFCLQSAGHGTENPKRTGEPGAACSNHGGSSPVGADNPATEHGAYSKFIDLLKSDLSEREQTALNALNLDDHGDDFVRDAIKEAYLKYKRTGDDRFLREVRQWMSEFNVVENADQVELNGHLDVDATHELSEQEREHLDQLTGLE